MSEREFQLALAELIDRMTITQIKSTLLETNSQDLVNEMQKLRKDVSAIIDEKNLKVDGTFVQSIIILAQMNLHIWHNKDEMQENIDQEETYLKLLKSAHQLNGYRNEMKNNILKIEGSTDESQIRSNFETDGLDINLLNS